MVRHMGNFHDLVEKIFFIQGTIYRDFFEFPTACYDFIFKYIMNLKGVAPDYGTLVPLFAWRIKRNEFGHFLIITSISNLLSYVLRINYYKVFSSKAVTILNYSFEKFIPLKKKRITH